MDTDSPGGISGEKMGLPWFFWVFLGLVALLLFRFRLKMAKSHKYWKDKGVHQLKPIPIFGNWWPVFSLNLIMGDFYAKVYEENPNHKFVGVYCFLRPVLVIRDANIVEKVLVKDFIHFPNRGFEHDFQRGPFDSALNLLKFGKWKSVRAKVTSAFTLDKLKLTLPQAVRCAENMVNMVQTEGEGHYDLKALVSIFSCDVIASCVFGVNLESALTCNSEFMKKSQKVFYKSRLRLCFLYLVTAFPWLRNVINVSLIGDDVAAYFNKMLRDVINEKKSKKSDRKDVINFLIEIQEKGVLNEDESLLINENSDSPKIDIELTDDLLMGQAFMFLSGGFDTTSSLLHYVLFELSRNPLYQEKARREVKKILSENKGHFTYEGLSRMTLLEKCLKETLRLYPPTSVLLRECAKEYTFDNGLSVKPGQLIAIPVRGFHMDPDFYPDPEEFRPERFDYAPVKGTYLPFGAGPRMCIGTKYTIFMVKMGLAVLLKNFTFSPSPKTKLPVIFDPKSFTNSPLKKLYVKIAKIS